MVLGWKKARELFLKNLRYTGNSVPHTPFRASDSLLTFYRDLLQLQAEVHAYRIGVLPLGRVALTSFSSNLL